MHDLYINLFPVFLHLVMNQVNVCIIEGLNVDKPVSIVLISTDYFVSTAVLNAETKNAET